MSVAIESGHGDSLRDEVEAEYRHEDPDVPDEDGAIPTTNSYFDWESCCF